MDKISAAEMAALEMLKRVSESYPMRAMASAKKQIKEDIAAIRSRDPAAKSDLEVLLLYSGLHAVLAYRVAHRLYVNDHTLSARAISQAARFLTGIEIHPGATIGKGLVIDHGSGVVIGETCEIGDNCTLYQGVTLGGTGKDAGKRHPTLCDNVLVGAGAKVLGPIVIQSNSKIAANAVVLKDIPGDSTAVGIPARVARHEGRRVDDLDQIHVPDPIAQEFARLEQKIEQLQSELDEIKSKKVKAKKEKVKE
ncbi:MAG: serine O-acetyltransferase [Clostridia bacterium]|nr:serine O-acetyltransferase [Clostridia bacterium]